MPRGGEKRDAFLLSAVCSARGGETEKSGSDALRGTLRRKSERSGKKIVVSGHRGFGSEQKEERCTQARKRQGSKALFGKSARDCRGQQPFLDTHRSKHLFEFPFLSSAFIATNGKCLLFRQFRLAPPEQPPLPLFSLRESCFLGKGTSSERARETPGVNRQSRQVSPVSPVTSLSPKKSGCNLASLHTQLRTGFPHPRTPIYIYIHIFGWVFACA